MSTAVRQQLIVMLISKLLPPSLHSFSSSFVLSLSLCPLSLLSLCYCLAHPFTLAFLLYPLQLFLVLPLSGLLPSLFLSLSSPSSFLQLILLLSPSCITSPSSFVCFLRSLSHSLLLSLTYLSFCSSLSSHYFIFLFPPLLSSPYRQALLRGLSETQCQLFRTHSVCKYASVCMCICLCVCMQVHVAQTRQPGLTVNCV